MRLRLIFFGVFLLSKFCANLCGGGQKEKNKYKNINQSMIGKPIINAINRDAPYFFLRNLFDFLFLFLFYFYKKKIKKTKQNKEKKRMTKPVYCAATPAVTNMPEPTVAPTPNAMI